jgi:hypothetical protein
VDTLIADTIPEEREFYGYQRLLTQPITFQCITALSDNKHQTCVREMAKFVMEMIYYRIKFTFKGAEKQRLLRKLF